nr:hypothetical protein B0A51_07712 [Rachicladosporium sp. CCFEE 5018]
MGPVAASLSEGEINSGDEEKATKPSTHPARHGVVNNSTRLPSGASSRAPHIDSAREAMAKSPYRAGRSGSPYRTKRRSPSSSRSRSGSLSRSPSPPPRRGLNDRLRSRSPSPRRGDTARTGEKRPRGADHYTAKSKSDSRRFKVHYEDQSADRKSTFSTLKINGPSTRPPIGPRAPADRTVQNGRARSRSPYRKPATTINSNHGGQFDKESTSAAPASSVPSMKSNGFTESSSKDKPASATKSNTARGAEVGADTLAVDSVPEPKLSEDDLIEQRRKKREAIKAKYKTQQTPLLVQALEQSAISAPSTPHHDSSGPPSVQASPPASIDSPRTPHSPGSPAEFAVADDEELANRKQGDGSGDEEEGPSAADYDPNMQEDRPDHKVQPSKLSDVQVPVTAAQQESRATAPPSKKEFDMFADDEDEDMFAVTTTAPKAATVGEARTLDQNLLDNWDYPDGHYRIILGEILDGRYVVQQQIGKGTFATVVRAKDTKTDKDVAVKIACNNETMYKAGTKEMEMLSMLNAADTEDKKHIIRLHRNFDHKGHLCLVFENLSADLREVLKKFGRNVGLNLKAIRAYAQQMFLALSHLKRCEVLHADLKPDNILVNHERSRLKICDLGTAAKAQDAEITPYLVSRFYRAPEVILGIPFDYAIDMWSIGCTLFELYTGRILFAGSDNNQMLRSIQECRGKFPKRMLLRSTLGDKHFVGGDPDFIFVSQERDKITGKTNMRQMNFIKTEPGKDLRARLTANAKGMSAADLKELYAFVDLLEKCLQLDPTRRVSPNDALRHHFIQHAQPAGTAGVVKVKPAMPAPLRMR